VRQPSFLRPLVRDPGGAFLLRNTRTGAALVSFVEPAFDSHARNRGLLGRTALPSDRAIVIAPCGAVHTWFMKFTIDALFVNRDGTVRRVVLSLRPFRISASLMSHCVIETTAGVIAASGTRAGDALRLEPLAASSAPAQVAE